MAPVGACARGWLRISDHRAFLARNLETRQHALSFCPRLAKELRVELGKAEAAFTEEPGPMKSECRNGTMKSLLNRIYQAALEN